MQSPSFNMFWFSVSVLVHFGCTGAAIKLRDNNKFPAVILFGDSIVDTGNNNYILTVAKANFPPYGRDFKGGVATGRFSDGKVPSDFIVEELGIKELLPPYLDPNLGPEDLLTGVSFASGSSGYDPLTSAIWSVISLENQLKMFKEYITKLKWIAGEEKTNAILTKSFFGVVASSNDIANTYYNFHIRELQYNISTYVDILVASASTFVQGLYGLGARKIAVFSAPPIGCLPSTKTLAGDIFPRKGGCVEICNQGAQLFNNKLSAEIDRLDGYLPHARIVFIDIYSTMFDLLQNPNKYGFENVDRGCCGTGIIEASILCNPFSLGTCENASSYLFWDSYHLTERAYKMLVSDTLKKYINRFL